MKNGWLIVGLIVSSVSIIICAFTNNIPFLLVSGFTLVCNTILIVASKTK